MWRAWVDIAPGDDAGMSRFTEDQRALFLLISLVVYLVLSAFATHNLLGELILACSMFVILGAAVLELSPKRGIRLPTALLALLSAIFMVVRILHPGPLVLVTNWVLLVGFLGIVAVTLFMHLGQPGRITDARIFTSVSLYFLIAMFYFTLFSLLDAVHPGSFAGIGSASSAFFASHSLVYFSLVTLTTLGYGDIVPLTDPARMFAALESATGVLYIAITVARLVAAYQNTGTDNT